LTKSCVKDGILNHRRAFVVVLFAVTGLTALGGCASSRAPQALFYSPAGLSALGAPAAATPPSATGSNTAVVRGQNPPAAEPSDGLFRSGVRLAQYTAPAAPNNSTYPVGPPPQSGSGAVPAAGVPAVG